jgi:Holliday junction resolvasome RuvABC DNA-binding subunit
METSTRYVDPQAVAAFFLALAFVVYCCGCFIYGALSENAKPLFQKFNEENRDLLNSFNVNRTNNPPVVTQKTSVHIKEVSIVQEVKKNKPDERLLQDCIAALVSFGSKKREATAVATNFFQSHPEIKTVEEFIKEYFKNEY